MGHQLLLLLVRYLLTPMVHGEPWGFQKIGSMVNWGCRGLQGVEILLL
ncbi:hypothetical protein [Lacrimispora amygdalina]